MNNFSKHIILLFIIGCTQIIQSQNSLTSDSIQIYIEKAEKLQKEYKYEKSLEIAQAALQNAKYNNDDKSLGLIYSIIAKNYEINEDSAKAISNYRKALTYAKSSKSKALETDLYNNLARAFTRKNLTRKTGVDYYKQSYKYAISLKDTARMIRPLLNLGEYYISRSDFDSAFEYLDPARKLIQDKSSNLDQIS